MLSVTSDTVLLRGSTHALVSENWEMFSWRPLYEVIPSLFPPPCPAFA